MASSREREDLCSLLLMLTGWVNTLVGGQQSGASGFMFFIVNVDKLGKYSCGWPTVGSKRIDVLYC